MKSKSTAIRLLGGLLMAVAMLPWVSGSAAQAAVTVHLDKKWIGTTSTNANLNHSDCNYGEIQQAHSGTGWHFVLAPGDGLTSFTAYFQTAGAITVTTTETASGVIVQDGKGAVIFTPTADTLVAGPSTYPGDGSAASGEVLQLSHICTGIPTTPPSTPVSTPVTTPASTPASTPPASVAPTKASSPSASVQGVKNRKPPAVLPHTGSGMSLGMALTISFGLLLGGAALMFAPRGLTADKGKRRRH